MMKNLRSFIAIAAIGLSGSAIGQITMATQDTTICPGDSISLIATTADTSYFVDVNWPFNPVTMASPTTVSLTDDDVSNALPIGFTFTFFGIDYTTFEISSNGFIGFGITDNGCCTGDIIPDPGTPNNLIAFAWEDLNPSSGGTVSYETIGTAPNRRLVVTFDQVPHYSGPAITSQVILNEGSNIIEVHTTDMQNTGNGHTMGIEDATGFNAYPYPGRNSDPSWNAANEGAAWLPSGKVYWHEATVPNLQDSGTVFMAAPTGPTMYYAEDASGNLDSVLVSTHPDPAAGFDFAISNGNVVSFTDTSNAAASWWWDFGDGFTAAGVQNPTHFFGSTGSFDVTMYIESAEGCVDSVTQTITIGSGLGVDAHQLADFSIYPNPSNENVTVQIGQEWDFIEVISGEGRLVKMISSSEVSNRDMIQLSDADFGGNQGVYMLRLVHGQSTAIKRIVRVK